MPKWRKDHIFDIPFLPMREMCICKQN